MILLLVTVNTISFFSIFGTFATYPIFLPVVPFFPDSMDFSGNSRYSEIENSMNFGGFLCRVSRKITVRRKSGFLEFFSSYLCFLFWSFSYPLSFPLRCCRPLCWPSSVRDVWFPCFSLIFSPGIYGTEFDLFWV